jgi:lactoylglutathione lyase
MYSKRVLILLACLINNSYMNTRLTSQAPFQIQAYDHVGIRVSNREVSIPFYERLGFKQTAYFLDEQANEMMSPSGVRINLIFNGATQPNRHNVLLDEPIKLPGVTHPAFVVDDLSALKNWLMREGIPITEGPVAIGERRIVLFVRDPDGTVLEFDQLI